MSDDISKAEISGKETAQNEGIAEQEVANTAKADEPGSKPQKGAKKIRIVCGIIAAAIALSLLVTLVIIPHAKYDEAQEALDAGDFDTAITGFQEIGADDKAQESKDAKSYSEADEQAQDGQYYEAGLGFAGISGYTDAASRAADCAEELISSENYGGASKILSSLGDEYANRASYASDMAEKAAAFQKAEEYYEAGKLADAQDAFSKVDDDFSLSGVKAADRKSSLASAQGIVDACGTFKSVKPSSISCSSTSKQFGYSPGDWEADADGDGSTLEVTAKPQDDGTFLLQGSAHFNRIANYSPWSSGLTSETVSKNFTLQTSSVPSSVSGDAETSFNYDGSWHMAWERVDKDDDAYFDYTYKASYTFQK